MNGVSINHAQNANNTKAAKPPPMGPTPPAPASAPPTPPVHTNSNSMSPSTTNRSNPSYNHAANTNGHNHQVQKGKKKNDVPIDPATMYESLKNRIAALEEEEVLEEEEERRFAEEAVKSVKGMEEAAIHSKYIELFAELKRLERNHAKEKQKLVKDKDSAKSQLTKANQTKARMENLARELQKDNKKLREDGKRLAQSVEDAQEELIQMKDDLAKRAHKTKKQDAKFREMPEILVKVVCRYRAELFFRISRKTKLSRLFSAWTERMERPAIGKVLDGSNEALVGGTANGAVMSEVTAGLSSGFLKTPSTQFIFLHCGRNVEPEQTPEEAGIEDGDEVLAVEMMDLTEGPGPQEWSNHAEPRLEKLKKNWSSNSKEAKRTLEELFDDVARERLKEILRQYELREKHFECVIRSKELEVLLSRARAAEQKQLADSEKTRASKQEEESMQLRKDLEDAQNGQTLLIDKLIACCKEPNAERTQRLFASLREELERKRPRGAKKSAGTMGG